MLPLWYQTPSGYWTEYRQPVVLDVPVYDEDDDIILAAWYRMMQYYYRG